MKRAWSAAYPAAFGVTYVLLSFASLPTPTTDLVNVMRQLVSMATGQRLDPLPYRAWFFADEQRPLELTPFQPAP